MALTEIPIELSSTPSIVDGGNATAITIDSSERVFIGKTATGLGTSGTEINPNGYVQITEDQSPPLYLNRLSTDGSIVNFYKDGSVVGSIGTAGSGTELYIAGAGTNATGIYLANSGKIVPMKASAISDATQDIGMSSYRWKDLYLSGGAYLGGTAAANKLEDYEEGTWTPTFSVTSGAVSIHTARYTKIGRQVIINLAFTVTSAIGTGNQFLTFTAPFTQYNSAGTDLGISSVYPDGDNNNTGLVLNSTNGNNTQFSMAFTLVASYGASSVIKSKLVYETNQ